MPRLTILLIAATVILTGCGKRLSGRYEAVAEIPRFQMPEMNNAKLQRQMDEQMKKSQETLQAMTRMALEFDGSRVRMSTASAIFEYRYRIDGNRLETIVEAMGQKIIMPMTIEPDGSITYIATHYYKTK